MIRGFELFCKIKFMKMSALDLFFLFMIDIKLHEHACPACLLEHPDWKKHGSYARNLISLVLQ